MSRSTPFRDFRRGILSYLPLVVIVPVPSFAPVSGQCSAGGQNFRNIAFVYIVS